MTKIHFPYKDYLAARNLYLHNEPTRNDKVGAIKTIRAATGLGLKESKDICESWIFNDDAVEEGYVFQTGSMNIIIADRGDEYTDLQQSLIEMVKAITKLSSSIDKLLNKED